MDDIPAHSLRSARPSQRFSPNSSARTGIYRPRKRRRRVTRLRAGHSDLDHSQFPSNVNFLCNFGGSMRFLFLIGLMTLSISNASAGTITCQVDIRKSSTEVYKEVGALVFEEGGVAEPAGMVPVSRALTVCCDHSDPPNETIRCGFAQGACWTIFNWSSSNVLFGKTFLQLIDFEHSVASGFESTRVKCSSN